MTWQFNAIPLFLYLGHLILSNSPSNQTKLRVGGLICAALTRPGVTATEKEKGRCLLELGMFAATHLHWFQGQSKKERGRCSLQPGGKALMRAALCTALWQGCPLGCTGRAQSATESHEKNREEKKHPLKEVQVCETYFSLNVTGAIFIFFLF